jgi:hypothetical protein
MVKQLIAAAATTATFPLLLPLTMLALLPSLPTKTI